MKRNVDQRGIWDTSKDFHGNLRGTPLNKALLGDD